MKLTPLLAIVALLVLFTAPAALAQAAVNGHLYLSVDDTVKVFHNGKFLMEGAWNKRDKVRKSAEVEMRVGDRLVFQLHNAVHSAFLQAQFVSADLKTVISFPNTAFKELTDPQAKDFQATALGFGNLRKTFAIKKTPYYLPFRSDSEPVWGSTDSCAIAAVIKPEMIRPVKP